MKNIKSKITYQLRVVIAQSPKVKLPVVMEVNELFEHTNPIIQQFRVLLVTIDSIKTIKVRTKSLDQNSVFNLLKNQN